MKLWLILAAALLSFVALTFLGRWGHAEGRRVAYVTSLQRCESRYPRYRCEIELARYFPEQHTEE